MSLDDEDDEKNNYNWKNATIVIPNFVYKKNQYSVINFQ